MTSGLALEIYAVDTVRIGQWWNYCGLVSPFTRLYGVTGGEAEVRHSGGVYKLKEGHLVLVPPFRAVDYRCDSWATKHHLLFSARWNNGEDVFSGDVDMTGWVLPAEAQFMALFQRLVEINPDCGLVIVDPFDRSYRASVLERGTHRQDVAAAVESEGIVRLLLAPFLRQLVHAEGKGAEPYIKARISKVVRYINRNLDRNLSLECLAEQVSVHPTYLSDSFYEHMKVRPSEYIQARRIERAQLLLQTVDSPVKTIAGLVGYVDPNYFCKVFKKYVGQSPGQFRSSKWPT